VATSVLWNFLQTIMQKLYAIRLQILKRQNSGMMFMEDGRVIFGATKLKPVDVFLTMKI
jgi:hypothetical protein